MNENPLAKLGDLSKPATTLIEKISEAVGGVFKPYQIVRVAKAEAEADRIRAESQIQVTDLSIGALCIASWRKRPRNSPISRR